MDIAIALRTARQQAGLTLRELAGRASTSHSALAAYEAGRKTPRTDTFLRLLDAAGVDLRAGRRPFGGTDDERAAELVDVLLLAEHFPARHDQTLAAPRFGAAPVPA